MLPPSSVLRARQIANPRYAPNERVEVLVVLESQPQRFPHVPREGQLTIASMLLSRSQRNFATTSGPAMRSSAATMSRRP